MNLVVVHREPAAQPWYLITNLYQTGVVERTYRKRMRIEEAFRDAKHRHGLDKMSLSQPRRYENMMTLLALAVLTALGHTRRHGDPKLATKRNGKVLSVFMFGFILTHYHHHSPSTYLHLLREAMP